MATAVYQRPSVIVPRKRSVPLPTPCLSQHPVFAKSTHAALQAVTRAESSSAPPVSVTVLNGSNGKTVRMHLDRTATVQQLKKRFLQETNPGSTGDVHLACNGKPVDDHQTLGMLNLRDTAQFITFQKCVGG
ncbi:hypothetical protein COCON_G00101140 [Conger conger]|uniref:Ubiquitin-like domain-containing protein n=1 Tax=Conger conger TaxID=82655 RepID=A0A9Q1DHR5_CONCO|nr:hypothetical protein COCON_G00101140 [Conger conger]